MSLFSDKLDQLESRLQTLIEGHLARLLPTQKHRDDLVQRLVYAMTTGTQPREDGVVLAPDIYILLVHPDLAPGLETNQGLLAELTATIHQAGTSAGLAFAQTPVVYVSQNADVDKNSVAVVARISQDVLSETAESISRLETQPGNIPRDAFLIVNGAKIFPLDRGMVNIGRRPDNDLVIDDFRVSRTHAQLRAVRGKYVLSDLDSKGGTFVNDERVVQRILRPHDVISLAGVPLVFGQDPGTDIHLGATQQMPVSPASESSGEGEGSTEDNLI